MSSNRNVVLATEEMYHIFNRGVERRPIFTDKWEYRRALDTIRYYRFSEPPIRYSKYIILEEKKRVQLLKALLTSQLQVDILAFCLMPNHFHLLLKQTANSGISRFVSKFCDSYSKYFNIKHDRIGPLFQGPFKSVRVESEEQLIHLSRYIHLNPTSSFLIKESELDSYPWSSLPEYLASQGNTLSNPKLIGELFKSPSKYRDFVHNQVDYAQKMEHIKHLAFDEEE
ncbi:transposase [Candidatus Gottesmanbacteria bacterium]|nr:transposase [Candidatus Gottesmanbacteria bacterium]